MKHHRDSINPSPTSNHTLISQNKLKKKLQRPDLCFYGKMNGKKNTSVTLLPYIRTYLH